MTTLISSVASSTNSFLSARKEIILAILAALIATLLFYAQALARGSLDAGFVYTGDFWNVCVAHIAQTNSLVSRGAFSGIDFSTHGGASEFFLRPNLYPYHPLVLLYSFVSRSAAPERLIRFSVILIALHSFVGCYFTMRLALRYLKLGIGLGLFISVGYIFSVQTVSALFYPPYIFCMAMLPWAIYGGLAISEHFSIGRTLLHSIPVFIMFTGGYVAIGLSCIALSWGFIAAYLLYIEAQKRSPAQRMWHLTIASTPFLIAGGVAGPLYLAMFQYFHLVQFSSVVSLFFSAHQLSEQPRAILRLLSSRLYYAAPMYEFTLVWGIIPVTITAIFFFGLRNAEELSESEWRLFKVAAAVYAFVVLAIYGDYSAASDLLYFVPGIGTMHIYQRHLLAGQFFLIIPIALMLKAVTHRTNYFAAKIALLVLVGLLAFCAHILAINSSIATQLHVTDYIVFELLLGVLFTAALFIPGKAFIFLVSTFLMMLIPLDHIYDYSNRPDKKNAAQGTQHLILDKLDRDSNQRIMSYFRSNSQKAIIKYLDLTPGAPNVATFSRNYPWFVAMNLPLSSYGGYDFLLAQRADYGRKMVFNAPGGMWVMRPDWTWVAKTGGEFVIYQEGNPINEPYLTNVADLRDASKVLRLSNNLVVAPIRFPPPGFGAAPVQGRYVRVQLSGTNALSLAEVQVLGIRDAGVTNLGLGKPAIQSSSLYGDSGSASKAVDGNTNGEPGAGSVTNTKLEPNAWWEVDLGTSSQISSITIWNRTDGAGDRLHDYWVFVSDKPFMATDSPLTLQKRAGTVSSHQTTTPTPTPNTTIAAGETSDSSEAVLFDNGYLRVLGAAGSAVVKGFQTNGASKLVLDLAASSPAKVQYLFWPNEHMKFYLQGDPVNTTIEEGLQTLRVGAGKQHLEIRYRHWAVELFLILYVAYALAVVTAFLGPLALTLFAGLRGRTKVA